ncbi:MAG: hypothetical protein SGPRY_013138 [Prymnesium sp.]
MSGRITDQIRGERIHSLKQPRRSPDLTNKARAQEQASHAERRRTLLSSIASPERVHLARHASPPSRPSCASRPSFASRPPSSAHAPRSPSYLHLEPGLERVYSAPPDASRRCSSATDSELADSTWPHDSAHARQQELRKERQREAQQVADRVHDLFGTIEEDAINDRLEESVFFEKVTNIKLVLGELSTDLSTTSLKRLEALKHAIAGLNELSCNAEELPDLPDDAILDEAEPSQFTRQLPLKLPRPDAASAHDITWITPSTANHTPPSRYSFASPDTRCQQLEAKLTVSENELEAARADLAASRSAQQKAKAEMAAMSEREEKRKEELSELDEALKLARNAKSSMQKELEQAKLELGTAHSEVEGAYQRGEQAATERFEELVGKFERTVFDLRTQLARSQVKREGLVERGVSLSRERACGETKLRSGGNKLECDIMSNHDDLMALIRDSVSHQPC